MVYPHIADETIQDRHEPESLAFLDTGTWCHDVMGYKAG